MIRSASKYLIILSTTLLFLCAPQRTKAWGPEGHAIVVKIAMQYVAPDVKQNILDLLGTMSLDTASVWMDIMRSNSDYDFMKPWHYIDFAKEKQYQPSTDENIVNRLIITFNELRHKKVLCRDQVRTDLLILFHLMGDLHQPLHTGYDDDLGGNKVAVQYDTLKTNLHSFWDENIIRLNNITFDDCLKLYQSNRAGLMDSIKGIHPVLWMKESRSLLPAVYNYPGFMIDKDYLKRNGDLVKRQLIIAGLRLAEMLNKLFVSDAPELNMKEVAARYSNGIEAKDVANYIGKKVTACGKVFGVKETANVTFINVGARYPNSPLTVVVFAKDRKNFPASLEELFNNKNICIKGEVVEFQKKMEIVVTGPGDIIVL